MPEDDRTPAVVEPGPNVRLVSEPNANTSVVRDRARATREISAGSIILSAKPSATALLFSEKGKRCDFCHSQVKKILRCKGCASYYYCDTTCQMADWKFKHKKICKTFNAWMASNAIQVLDEHLKMDMVLLTHLFAKIMALKKLDDFSNPRSEVALLASMMKNPQIHLPPGAGICPLSAGIPPKELVEDIYTRFGRNNFTLHSHFRTFAHGVYPLASRVFNHSCAPNAAAKYLIAKGHPVTMEVVALSTIKEGDEIFLPYMDPAMIQHRSEILGYTYGFTCECPSCKYLDSIGGGFGRPNIEPPPEHWQAILLGLSAIQPCSAEDLWQGIKQLPDDLKCIFHEDFLTRLTKMYSDLSHDGPFKHAIVIGELIWQAYKLIYPPNYPQTGLHCLEQAKTTWNGIVKERRNPTVLEFIPGESSMVTFRKYLDAAKEILTIIGPEGDPGGPLEELQVLEEMWATL